MMQDVWLPGEVSETSAALAVSAVTSTSVDRALDSASAFSAKGGISGMVPTPVVTIDLSISVFHQSSSQRSKSTHVTRVTAQQSVVAYSLTIQTNHLVPSCEQNSQGKTVCLMANTARHDPDFVLEATGLPSPLANSEAIKTGVQLVATSFLQSRGTSIVTGARLGGRITLVQLVDEEKSESSASQSFSAKLSTSMVELLDGSTDVAVSDASEARKASINDGAGGTITQEHSTAVVASTGHHPDAALAKRDASQFADDTKGKHLAAVADVASATMGSAGAPQVQLSLGWKSKSSKKEASQRSLLNTRAEIEGGIPGLTSLSVRPSSTAAGDSSMSAQISGLPQWINSARANGIVQGSTRSDLLQYLPFVEQCNSDNSRAVMQQLVRGAWWSSGDAGQSVDRGAAATASGSTNGQTGGQSDAESLPALVLKYISDGDPFKHLQVIDARTDEVEKLQADLKRNRVSSIDAHSVRFMNFGTLLQSAAMVAARNGGSSCQSIHGIESVAPGMASLEEQGVLCCTNSQACNSRSMTTMMRTSMRAADATPSDWIEAAEESQGTNGSFHRHVLAAAAVELNTMVVPDTAVILVSASCWQPVPARSSVGIGDRSAVLFFNKAIKMWVVADPAATRLLTTQEAFGCFPPDRLADDAGAALFTPKADSASFDAMAYLATIMSFRLITEGKTSLIQLAMRKHPLYLEERSFSTVSNAQLEFQMIGVLSGDSAESESSTKVEGDKGGKGSDIGKGDEGAQGDAGGDGDKGGDSSTLLQSQAHASSKDAAVQRGMRRVRRNRRLHRPHHKVKKDPVGKVHVAFFDVVRGSLHGSSSGVQPGDVTFDPAHMGTFGADMRDEHADAEAWKRAQVAMQQPVCVHGGPHRVIARKEFLLLALGELNRLHKNLRASHEQCDAKSLKALEIGNDACTGDGDPCNTMEEAVAKLGYSGAIMGTTKPACRDSARVKETAAVNRKLALDTRGDRSAVHAVGMHLTTMRRILATSFTTGGVEPVIVPESGDVGTGERARSSQVQPAAQSGNGDASPEGASIDGEDS